MEEPVAYHPTPSPVKLPVLPCPVCGLIDTPVVGPGRGPHVGELRCQAGHHIKWAPKALLGVQEGRGMGGIARCLIVGVIGKYGVEVRYATSGTPCASLTLVVSDQGSDGKVHDLYVPCEVWGKKAEAAGELEAGQLCLFEGRLQKRKKGEVWDWLISGFELTPITLPVASMTGSTN